MRPVVGVLLAAGAGRRFGGDKLLQPLPGGEPLGVAAARTLCGVVPDTVAVVRPGDAALAVQLGALGLRVVGNPQADDGIGASIAIGVGAAAGAGGWLIALADMPYVRRETIAALAQSLAVGASIVAPVCRGRRGHPVGFAAHWGAQLLSLRGDRGARALLAANPSALVLHDTDDDGVLRDVDVPGDLARAAAPDDVRPTR